ncbi:hypothetical protein KEJ40_02785 [Candidatus Bathyarchaeota archaeon]|nr:hypothetical protein [Candidatus Bathyarchaeota archaeon]
MKLRLSQSEPVSVVILTGVVLAIALAVYGYFASQAAISSYNQSIQSELARLRFNTVIDELYFNKTDHFIFVKRLDTSSARIMFSLVVGEYYSDTLLVYKDLSSQPGCRILLLKGDGGMYRPYSPSASLIPLARVYPSVDKPPLYTGYTQAVTVYEVWAEPSPSGCSILLDAKIGVLIDKGYPILMILESIGDKYYIVDSLQLRGV